MTTREELIQHAANAGLKDNPALSDAEFQSAVLDCLEKLPDAKDPDNPKVGEWEGLPKKTTDWCNAIFQAEKEASEKSVSKNKAEAKKGKKNKAEDKKKLEAAKVEAKKKSANVKHNSGGKLFRKGTGSEAIYNIVKDSMPGGISKVDVVAEAVKRKIKSTNIKARAVDVLKMCTVVKGQSYSGIMKLKDDLYFTTPENELKALNGEKDEPAKKVEKAETKPEAKNETKPNAKANKGKGKGKSKGNGKKK